MRVILVIAGVLILASCTSTPYVPPPSACSTEPGGQACEVERYLNAP
jgi:hypothetical protein